jgi:hypothetical protein
MSASYEPREIVEVNHRRRIEISSALVKPNASGTRCSQIGQRSNNLRPFYSCDLMS